MRILFVSTMIGAPFGGSEELWSQTALRLAKDNQCIVGAVAKGWTPMPPHHRALQEAGSQLFFPKGKITVTPPVHKRLLNRLLPGKLQYQTLTRRDDYSALPEFKPELVVISQGGQNEGSDWARECRKQQIAYVVINQLVKNAEWMVDGQAAQATKDMYTEAVMCFFTCRNNIAVLEKQLAMQLINAQIHANPFHTAYENNLPYPVSDTFKLAFPAALMVFHKGQDVLFEMLRQQKWQQRPLQINLYGKGPHEEQLRELKEHWKLENVHFKGYVSDMDEIWRTNHGMILTSRMEGVPVVLVGAMLCKRMAIVTDVGGHAEYIDNGVNGFVAKAPTVELIDEAMEKAWEHRGEWEQMGVNAAEKVKRMIPFDPVGVFVEKLRECIANAHKPQEI